MKIFPINLILFGFLSILFLTCKPLTEEKIQPKISFSFDDGSTSDMPNFKLKEWNQKILNHLKKHELKSVLFAMGRSLDNPKGKYILSSWNDSGHLIANHTYSHPYFNSDEVSLIDFQNELLKNDSIIRQYDNFYPYFRFPYLKEGNTEEKRDGFRNFLKKNNYKNGHVSIDASDWYVYGRLRDRLRSDSTASISGFRDYYLEHIYGRALYYDSISTQLTGRKINHVILLHHNLASALFLGDLLEHFKNKGWKIMDIDEAYKDPFYELELDVLPAGESLVWSMAKQKGIYDDILRYPAEGQKYEKQKMDDLGL